MTNTVLKRYHVHSDFPCAVVAHAEGRFVNADEHLAREACIAELEAEIERLTGMLHAKGNQCQDEGYPHYGTPHGQASDAVMTTFGCRLREAVEAHRMTVTEFSRRTGFTLANLSHFLHGQRKPRLQSLEILIRELPKVDVAWLVMGYEHPLATRASEAAPKRFIDDDAEAWDHELKTDPAVFEAVLNGIKTHEIRYNDRGFKIGDRLRLRETEHTGQEMRGPEPLPLAYTGRECSRTVSHVLDGYGLQPGWVILSFEAAPIAVGDAKPSYADGIEAAAKMLDAKANAYALEYGSDDMGSLSFGQGAHAQAKLEYHSTLLELAEDVRALASQAVPVTQDAQQAAEAVRDALEWYQVQVANCRKLTPEGDAARIALDGDGGQRAHAALASQPALVHISDAQVSAALASWRNRPTPQLAPKTDLDRMRNALMAALSAVPVTQDAQQASAPNIEWFRLVARVRDEIQNWAGADPTRTAIAAQRAMRKVEDFMDNGGVSPSKFTAPDATKGASV